MKKQMKEMWKSYKQAVKKENRTPKKCYYAGYVDGELAEITRQMEHVKAIRTSDIIGETPGENKPMDSEREMGQSLIPSCKVGE